MITQLIPMQKYLQNNLSNGVHRYAMRVADTTQPSASMSKTQTQRLPYENKTSIVRGSSHGTVSSISSSKKASSEYAIWYGSASTPSVPPAMPSSGEASDEYEAWYGNTRAPSISPAISLPEGVVFH